MVVRCFFFLSGPVSLFSGELLKFRGVAITILYFLVSSLEVKAILKMTGLSFSPELWGAFLRHSTCPNFDWLSWNHSQTTWIFHHPNSPVISPDKAGTLFFYHLCGARSSKVDTSTPQEIHLGAPPNEVTTFPCFGTWKVERENHGKPKQNQGRSELKSPSHTINKNPGNDAGKLASTLDERFPPSFCESMNMKKWQRQHASMKYLPQWYTPKKSTRSPPPPFNILCMLMGVRPRCGFIHNLKVVFLPHDLQQTLELTQPQSSCKKWSQFTSQCRTICLSYNRFPQDGQRVFSVHQQKTATFSIKNHSSLE